MSKYRFENGKLFVLIDNTYVFCYSSIYATSKVQAVKAYELMKNEETK